MIWLELNWYEPVGVWLHLICNVSHLSYHSHHTWLVWSYLSAIRSTFIFKKFMGNSTYMDSRMRYRISIFLKIIDVLIFGMRGLSRYYSRKSRTFTCTADVHSLEDLKKQENSDTNKRKKYPDGKGIHLLSCRESIQEHPMCHTLCWVFSALSINLKFQQ